MNSPSTFAQPLDFLDQLALIPSLPAEPATCERHGDFEKRVISIVPNGRRIYSGCPECAQERSAELAAERREQEQKDRLALLSSAMDRACIPPKFRTCRFDTYVAKTDRQRRALAITKRYAETSGGGILVLCGKPGTGKTHLACAIAAAFIERHQSALFATVTSAVRHVKDTYRRDSDRSESQAMKDLVSPSLLVLDEVGVQLGTEHEMRILFEVVNERYADCRPTVLISNLDEAQLLGFVGARLMDRVKDGGAVIAFDWESHRGSKAA